MTGAALVFMLVLASDRFMVRPELLSFACLATLLALFDRFERSHDGTIYAVVAIQLFWVNVHGLFAVGVASDGELPDSLTRLLDHEAKAVMAIDSPQSSESIKPVKASGSRAGGRSVKK